MPYWNVTQIANNTNDLVGFTAQVNTQILGGWLGIGLAVMFDVIILIAMMTFTQDAPKGLLVVSWVNFILAILLFSLNLVPFWWLVFGLLALVLGMIFFQRRE